MIDVPLTRRIAKAHLGLGRLRQQPMLFAGRSQSSSFGLDGSCTLSSGVNGAKVGCFPGKRHAAEG